MGGSNPARISLSLSLSLSLSPLQLIHCNAKAGFDTVFGTFEMLRRRRRRREGKEGRKERRWEGERVGRPTHAHCQWASRVRRQWRPVPGHRHARNSNKCFFKSSPQAPGFFLSLFGEFSPIWRNTFSETLYIYPIVSSFTFFLFFKSTQIALNFQKSM